MVGTEEQRGRDGDKDEGAGAALEQPAGGGLRTLTTRGRCGHTWRAGGQESPAGGG